jgi:hypothetical protein
MDDKCDSSHTIRPRSSMVERVTSNDEVAGSIPSEGIQAHLQALNFCLFFFFFFWLVVMVVESFSEARKIFSIFIGAVLDLLLQFFF